MKIRVRWLCINLKETVDRISQFPSWKQGIASEALIKKVQEAYETCFMQMYIRVFKAKYWRTHVPFNWLLFSIDPTKVKLGEFHWNVYVWPLAKYGYHEHLPKLDENLDKYIIYFPRECFRLRPQNWWQQYLEDEPDFIAELAATFYYAVAKLKGAKSDKRQECKEEDGISKLLIVNSENTEDTTIDLMKEETSEVEHQPPHSEPPSETN